MTTNVLVAGPVNMSTPLSGTFLLEDCASIANGIRDGDWLEGGMGAFAGVADGLAMAVDPLGQGIAMGVGWLLEHMEPLKGWFNDLTGDAGEVMGFSGTWQNIATHMQDVSDELTRILGDLDNQHGQFFDTYRRFQTQSAAHAGAAAHLAAAMGVGMQLASSIVQIVHDLTRDALSTLIGTAISAVAETAITLGFAAPIAITQVATKAASLAAKIGKYVTKLIKAIKKLLPMLDDAARLFHTLHKTLDNALQSASDTTRTIIRKSDDAATPRFPNAGPRPIADGAIIDVTGYSHLTHPPSTTNGPANFTPADLATPPGTATFWSGKSVGPGGNDVGAGGVASGFATDSGRTTLEMHLNDRGISMPDYDPTDPSTVQAWEAVSRSFADGASGDVTVVLGDKVRLSSIWNVQEFPLLKSNPAVNTITAVNAATGKVTRLWP